MMPGVFFLQLAAGCMGMIAFSRVREVAWRYLRLMAVVSVAAVGAGLFFALVDGWGTWADRAASLLILAVGVACSVGWLAVAAVQSDRPRGSQRLWAAAGCAAALAAATALSLHADLVATRRPRPIAVPVIGLARAAATLSLGAALLGATTAAMLLGHRYLTETGLTIAPLRRLAKLLAGAVALRALWVLAMLWSAREQLTASGFEQVWLLLLLTIRVGIGLVGTAAFAYMVWDCVRRRSTQSATGLLYLSMVFVFLGELTGQYLMRTTGLAL